MTTVGAPEVVTVVAVMASVIDVTSVVVDVAGVSESGVLSTSDGLELDDSEPSVGLSIVVVLDFADVDSPSSASFSGVCSTTEGVSDCTSGLSDATDAADAADAAGAAAVGDAPASLA